MIKFETINGTLCRMVEPEPLQLDSQMPCVVRYIQDCSPMGRYMKRKFAMVINTVAIVSRIGTDGRAYSSDKIFAEEVEVLEIIGYPVEEGSHWWALYQMMQGEKICHKKSPSIVYYKHAGDIRREVRCDCVDYMSIDAWLNGADENGWQIYKEPELQYKVGDWVKYGIDSYLQVIEPSGKERTLCGTLSGVTIYPYTSCLTKASPSEVVIHIGCMSGTVVFVDSDRFILRGIGNSEMSNACIMFKMLDTSTRELVESLLKEQEDEK